MSRTTKYKALYFGVVGSGVTLLLWLVLRLQGNAAGLTVLAPALLLPGRVLGFF